MWLQEDIASSDEQTEEAPFDDEDLEIIIVTWPI